MGTSRGQWAHQITLAALSILKHEAYNQYSSLNCENQYVMEEEMESKQPLFYFWNMCIKLKSLLMKFLHFQREGVYSAYVDSLAEIILWLFTFDHSHYARWLSVHLHDLSNLQSISPNTYEEFVKGHFVTQKSSHKFSKLAHDQVHEQLNAMVKGDGGVIGITENESSFRRWMVAGPEIAQLLIDYRQKQEKGERLMTGITSKHLLLKGNSYLMSLM